MIDLRRENDIEQLRRIALVQQRQLELLLQKLRDKYEGDLEKLQQVLLEMEQRANEPASDQLDSDNSTSVESEWDEEDEDEDDEDDEDQSKKRRKKRTQFGNTPQPNLPEVAVVCKLDEPDLVCPCCGGMLHEMNGQFDTSEMIDVIEARYEVKKVKQQKYACNCGGTIETAPGLERVMPGSRYSLAFAIHIATNKYLDHMPLARQARKMRRFGLEITTQTLWDVLRSLGERLETANDLLLKKALSYSVIGLDQTGWKRLEDKNAKPWQMWCITAPDCVVHRIKADKSAKTFVDLVGDYVGTIVCDAASTHSAGIHDAALSRTEGGCANNQIILAGCWAHVFRKFRDAKKDHPEANVMMKWIKKLYALDARAEGDRDRLFALRQTDSKRILEKMKAWLWSQVVLETLSIGKAAAYTIRNWDKLTRFADDARIPLDNNATERGLRGPVVGRRNHFGSKSERGTQIAALFYSLMETAKLVGVDPARYLHEAALASSRGEVLLPGDLAH